MQITVDYKPAHAMAKVSLAAGEKIVAESGAMIGMSTSVDMQTQARGGIAKGLGRMFLGGESFFQNTFTATNGPGEVLLAHSLCGDIVTLDVNSDGYFIQGGSYIAATEGRGGQQ